VSAEPVGKSSARRTSDHSVEVQTRIELVKIAFRQLPAGTWISIVGVVALALLVWNGTFTATLIIWLGFMAVPIGWMIWLDRRFRRNTAQPAIDHRWAPYLVMAAALSAVGWGATPWIFPMLTESGPPQAAHLLLLAGLTTASMRVLLPMRKGSLLSVGITMVPVALFYLTSGDTARVVLGTFILLFVGYTHWTTLHGHRVLADAITTRFERETLATVLRSEIALRESHESELREARAKAESASKAKDEFIAAISHELRTPMNGVLGMLRVVQDTDLTSEQSGYLKTASASAEALLSLLNDVLDFSMIEANRIQLECAPFSPADTVRVVADLHHARARDKGLKFELRLEEDLPAAVLGDATRVRQIIMILASNAIKFTERGRVELKVDCVARSAQRATLHITVSDTGIGIDAPAIDKLFKPFTQADNSMSRRYGGIGLGLAISMRLTQAMGGALQVNSVVGQGTVFRLILPCTLPAVAAPPPRVDLAPKTVGRVLVVEDDSVNQQVIELFLKKLNVSAKLVGDGEAAVTVATSEDFDLVLMDCQLPGIDGLEATRQIRRKLAGKPLKIAALTANANPQVRDACLAAGMNEFLSKPVRFEQLSGLLQRSLPPG
jgi:signal transduction histidine kinase